MVKILMQIKENIYKKIDGMKKLNPIMILQKII